MRGGCGALRLRPGRPEGHGSGRRRSTAAFLVLAAVLGAPDLPAQDRVETELPEGLDLYVPPPALGPDGPALAALGRSLFFDPVLSRDSSVTCGSCHRPDLAFTDGRRTARGIEGRVGRRNVPTLVNRAYGHRFSLDGRASTLEDQVLAPIGSPREMDLDLDGLVSRLRRSEPMRQRFVRVLGGEPDSRGVARALAAYVRSIRSGDSRFDRFQSGEIGALTDQEIRGMRLFQGAARCSRCHLGPLLSDESFHNTGVAWRDGTPTDSGRAAVTGRPEDVGSFKTPTLREVSRTAPYMHDGSLATLEEVVEFYDRGGQPNPALDPLLQPLGLTPEEKRALVAFLAALEGRIAEG